MNSITPSSPSSISGTSSSSSSSSSFISETVYIIIFSVGLTAVLLTIILACYYFYKGQVWSSTTSLNQQRASPIAAAVVVPNPSLPQPAAGTKEALDEGLLSTYPKLSYSRLKQLQQQGIFPGSGGSCCSICLVDYKDDDTLLLLPYCAHFYHVTCGFQWLRLHPTCPVCRNLAAPASVRDRPLSQLDLVLALPIPEDDRAVVVQL